MSGLPPAPLGRLLMMEITSLKLRHGLCYH
jgi:hypothetical protein